MVARVARSLAEGYVDQVQGTTTAERMRSLGRLLEQRRIPVTIDDLAERTTMTTHACPYPRLAEEDSSVCNMERMLYSQLLGRDMELSRCRLDGGSQCQFQAK
jgi:predicted ArsR family transcriptional regulator